MEFEKIAGIIAEVLNIDAEEITPDMSFADDLGADSLDLAQIVMAFEDELGVEIDPEEIGSIQTVADVIDKIKDLA
ncbi:MAG: acyl carrier protein [Lachnospiraceae bacterium]|jgi:acyl carrier protein|nr:acyl carrier protein [Lachnospiraceae bacterium]MBR2531274.1 acyl carrier protein [Lachnospiraceae bacterium]